MKTTSCTESRRYAFDNAPRCGARTKRNNGKPCQAPAVRGKSRCRLHGGSKGSGANAGNQNALKHGNSTTKAKVTRRAVRKAIREWEKIKDSNLESL